MIYGERVRLRSIESEDLARYVKWFNDPEVRQGLNMFLPMSLVEEEKWFQGVLERDPIERPLAIDVMVDDEWIHVGGCGMFDVDHQARKAELGISIGDKSFWDRGFGTEGMRILVRHAFESLNLRRVFLRVFESNPRAIHVYRKLGFQEEGRLRQDRFSQGKFEDTLIMGLMRNEWKVNEEE